MRNQCYYVYVLASKSRVLYIGVTNNLALRVQQHRMGEGSEFTKKYRVHRLIHSESFHSPQEAIAREKELKGWRREKKIALIEATNPTWEDLTVNSE